MDSDFKDDLSRYLDLLRSACKETAYGYARVLRVSSTSSCMPHSSSMVTQASMGKAISLPLMFRCSSRDLPKDGFSTHASAKTNQQKLAECFKKLYWQYVCVLVFLNKHNSGEVKGKATLWNHVISVRVISHTQTQTRTHTHLGEL